MCVKFIKQRSFISILKLNMEEAVEEVLVCAVIAPSSIVYSESLNSGRKRKYRDYFRERDQYGGYKLTLEELRLKDPFSFRRYLRISTPAYGVLMSVF